MIAPCAFPAGERLADPAAGCLIETLDCCYRELPALYSLCRSDRGGLIARFGRQLLLSGEADAGELFAFAALHGVRSVEAAAGRLAAPPDGWRRVRHTLLGGSRGGEPLLGGVLTGELGRVFDILCASDERFAREASRLDWLSDLRRRTNRGRAAVLLLEGSATASVTAVGQGCALISLVACHPSARRRGLAARLVSGLSSSLLERGLRPLVVSQSAALDGWYRAIGFLPLGAIDIDTATAKEEVQHG